MKKITQQSRITFSFFIFSLGLIITFIFVDMKFFSNGLQKTAMANAIQLINEKEEKLFSYFDSSKNILNSINQSNYFNKYLEKKDEKYEDLSEFFLSITKINKNIMQFRYIDENGFEKIRVDRKKLNSKAMIISKNNLQNKSTRYYFTDSKKRKELWFSNLDLNMEKGKVVRPFIPTLRAILPVVKNKRFKGILIINYFMENVLNQITKTALYDVILLNKNAEILSHFDSKKSWSYYKENKLDILKNDYKKEYKNILNSQLYMNKKFISKALNLNTPKKLIFLVQFKNKYLEKNKDEQIKKYILVSSIIVFLSFIMSYIFSKYFKKILFLLKDSNKLNRLLGTEVNEKTKQLEELNQSLEIRIKEEIEKNKQKDEKIFSQAKHIAMTEMLGNIAHQWRQPLSLISTNASGIKLKYMYNQLDLEDIPKQMDLIIKKTQYLSNTIDSLDFIFEDKEYRQVVIQDIIEKVINILDSSLKSNFIKLENFAKQKQEHRVYTVTSDLIEVLINILTNAKDVLVYRKINNALISIDIEIKNNHLCIIIEDNAKGIEEENLSRIFEPYFTTKHKAQGTGLGLHMSYKIVKENLKGNIYAKNVNEGASFIIELPIKAI